MRNATGGLFLDTFYIRADQNLLEAFLLEFNNLSDNLVGRFFDNNFSACFQPHSGIVGSLDGLDFVGVYNNAPPVDSG
jgi:hypothetical protein